MEVSNDDDVSHIIQDAGLKAISDLEASLRGFSKRLETGDGDRVKQEVPDLQQDALTYVGRIEEAMVQGFPFKVPERFASLPQLKASLCPLHSFTAVSSSCLI